MIKKILSRSLNLLDLLFVKAANCSRVFFYIYTIFRKKFTRERFVVQSGRINFYGKSIDHQANSAALRRSIHRLEKGLLMRPRQAIFAMDYIEQTIEYYERSVSAVQLGQDWNELRWSYEVLTEFFRVVGSLPSIDRARDRFLRIPLPAGALIEPPYSRIPFPHRETAKADISYEKFLLLTKQRASVRWFLPTLVPEDLVEKALTVALQAPSACNRQPFFFRYFDNVTDASRVASIAMGTTGYAHQIPALLVLLGDWSCFEDERDRHLPYIDGSLAAMQLMLALETLGLASCPINWPDVESLERKMDRELNLPPYVRPIMLIAVGYPDPEGGVAYSAKKSPATVLQRGG